MKTEIIGAVCNKFTNCSIKIAMLRIMFSWVSFLFYDEFWKKYTLTSILSGWLFRKLCNSQSKVRVGKNGVPQRHFMNFQTFVQ